MPLDRFQTIISLISSFRHNLETTARNSQIIRSHSIMLLWDTSGWLKSVYQPPSSLYKSWNHTSFLELVDKPPDSCKGVPFCTTSSHGATEYRCLPGWLGGNLKTTYKFRAVWFWRESLLHIGVLELWVIQLTSRAFLPFLKGTLQKVLTEHFSTVP